MVGKIDDFINNRSSYILFGILALSALLRLYHINFQSLWIDELYSIIPTDPKNSVASIIEYCKTDQPPLFFLYIHSVFSLFGYNELVGRLACAVIGLFGILVMYFLGAECKGKQTGLLASLITAVNYFHIYYSQELRFYSMAFLFSALSYLFFIRAFKRNKIFDFTAYIVTTTSLLYIHYFGMFVFFSQAIAFLVLLFYKWNAKFLLLSILSAIIIVIGFSPWLPVIFDGLGEVLPHIKQPKPQFVAQYFYYYTGKDAVTTAIFCFFIFQALKSLIRKNPDNKGAKPVYLIVLIWIIVTYLFPYFRSLLVTPMLADRYTIVTLPGCIILVALGWDDRKMGKLKYILPITLLFSAVLNLFFFRNYYTQIIKDQWREASNIVLSKNQYRYPTYSTYAWHFDFYFHDQPEKVNDLYSSDLSNVEKFWLLVAHLTEEEQEAQITALKEKFVVIERHTFFGSNAVLFERRHN